LRFFGASPLLPEKTAPNRAFPNVFPKRHYVNLAAIPVSVRLLRALRSRTFADAPNIVRRTFAPFAFGVREPPNAPYLCPMARQAPDPETRLKALEMLREGASIREAARTLGLSPATVHKWKEADAQPGAQEDSVPTAGVRERSANGAGERSRTSAPDKTDSERLPNAFESLLKEKDSRIEDLQTAAADLRKTVAALTDALSDEREARRRADVMLQHALARPALSPSEIPPVPRPSGAKWELWLFAAAIAALGLLAAALLLR